MSLIFRTAASQPGRSMTSRRLRTVCFEPRARLGSAALGLASAAVLFAACSSDPPPVVTPPKPTPGVVLRLSVAQGLASRFIKAVDFVIDTAPYGPSLLLRNQVAAPATYGSVAYSLETRNVDDDSDSELTGTISTNPFVSAQPVEVFIPTPAEITAAGVPFSVRVSARGDGGVVGSVTVLTLADGTAPAFPREGRITVDAALQCVPGATCATAANRPPVLAAYPEIFKVRRWYPIEIKAAAFDPDGDAITYSIPSEDLAPLPGGATFDGASFKWVPAQEAVRTAPWKVRLRANDGRGGQAESTFQISVVQQSSSPVWTQVAPQFAYELTEIVVAVHAAHPDGQALSFEFDNVGIPAGSNAEFDETTMLFRWTPTIDDARVKPWNARIIARDERGGSSVLTIPITVIDRNRAPSISAPSVVTIKAGVTSSVFVGTFDPDGDALTVTHEPVQFPQGAITGFDVATGVFRWSPTVRDVRDQPYLVYFRVRDPRGGSAQTTTSITVSATNSSPTIATVRSASVTETETVSFGVTATDADGDAVTVEADLSLFPAGATPTFAAGQFSWTPAEGFADPDPYRVTFTARDAKGAVSQVLVSVLVERFIPGAPNPPVLVTTTPPSPSNSKRPVLVGTSLAEAYITIYRSPDCTGDYADYFQAAGDGNFQSSELDVGENSTTVFSANATNARDRVSNCSVMPLTYVNDIVPPTSPRLLSVAPTSPANNNSPVVTGSGDAGSTVRIFVSEMRTPAMPCTGTPVASGVVNELGGFSITVPVADNTTNTLTANAIDLATNVSACSTSLAFVEDSRVPPVPVLTELTPRSPSNVNDIHALGTAEATIKVLLFGDAACTQSLGEGFADAGGRFDIPLHVPSDSVLTVFTRSVTPVGNFSPCSTVNVSYVEDSTPPSKPVITGSTPASPSPTSTSPLLRGTGEPLSIIRIYANGSCANTPAANTTANAAGVFTLSLAVGSNLTTTLSALSVDSAGNISFCSDPFRFTHDNVSPASATLSNLIPASPSNATLTPSVRGQAEAGATVRFYGTSACTGTVLGTGVPGVDSAFVIPVTVGANATTTLYAQVVDAAGNSSACAGPITFIHDNIAPAMPTGVLTVPTSPSRTELSPRLRGAAEPGTTVRIYTGGTCTGTPALTGTADAFSVGIPFPVVANTTTVFRVSAIDAAGNESPCTDALSYIHDSTPPVSPASLSTLPASPSRTEVAPFVKGTAEDGSTVFVYSSADCTGTPLASGTAAAFSSTGIAASVSANATTNLRATARDAAGNTSPCSSPVVYTHDNLAPATPTGLSTIPGSPSNSVTSPRVKGTAEAASTVRLYLDVNCSGAVVGSGTAADFAGTGIVATLASNSTSQLHVSATDVAGNPSACSAAVAYIHDNLRPDAPTTLLTVPVSPSSSVLNPRVTGSAEAGSTVRLFLTADCSGTPPVTGTAAAFASPGLQLTVGLNSTTNVRFTAVDAAGNESLCSAPVTYVHDNTAPNAPTGLVTVPATLSNSVLAPKVLGTTEAASRVSLFTTTDCSGIAAATGTAEEFAGVGIAITVGANATTAIRAKTTDAAGNISPCSAPVSYLHDSLAPLAPTIATVTPVGPSSNNKPTLKGTAEAGSTVKLFGAATACSGTPLATGSAADFAAAGLEVTVLANVVTPLSANATDPAGNISPCSAVVSYTHDATPPPVPTVVSVAPVSPSRTNTTPVVSGTAEAASTVQLFDNAQCSGTSLVSGVATAQGAYTLTPTVAVNSTTTFYAQATDVAGNPSLCSTTSVAYVHDSLSPTSVAVTPATGAFRGTELTCAATGSVGQGAVIEYQWKLIDALIDGATAATYTVAAGDRDKAVRCFARAQLGELFSGYVGSNSVVATNRQPAAFVSSVTGTATLNSTLTCAGDYASPDLDGDAVQFGSARWELSSDGTTWATVAEAVAETFTILPAHDGKFLRCALTISDQPGLTREGAVSAAAGPVIPIYTAKPVTCTKPPVWAYYKAGMDAGDVFNVTCTTELPLVLAPYVKSTNCPGLAFNGAVLAGVLPGTSNGCHVEVGARTTGGVVCADCATDSVDLRLAKQVTDLVACTTGTNRGSEPSSMLVFNDGTGEKLFFAAYTNPANGDCASPTRGYAFYTYDGVSAPQALTYQPNAGAMPPVTATRLGASLYHDGAFYVNVNDMLVKLEGGVLSRFTLDLGKIRQLLFHDGLLFAQTDRLLVQIDPTLAGSSDIGGSEVDQDGPPGPMVVYNGALYFTFRTPSATSKLMRVAGPDYDVATPVDAASTAQQPGTPVVFENKLFFSAWDGVGTAPLRKLMSFDVNAAGSQVAVPFDVPSYAGTFHDVRGLRVINDVLYFISATDSPDDSNVHYNSVYRLKAGAAKQLVTHITPTVFLKTLVPGVNSVLGVTLSPSAVPYVLQAYPLDGATPMEAHYMTGPVNIVPTTGYTIGAHQVVAFPHVPDVNEEEYVQRVVTFKGETYFAGEGDGDTSGYELWKLAEPRVTCATLKAQTPTAADGAYRLSLPGSAPFDGYCLMSADGGGWTLAASYPAGSDPEPAGWATGAQVGTAFNSPTALFKLSDATLNTLVTQGYRTHAVATVCTDGPCTVDQVLFFKASCAYSSAAQSPACSKAYTDVAFATATPANTAGSPPAQHWGLVDSAGGSSSISSLVSSHDPAATLSVCVGTLAGPAHACNGRLNSLSEVERAELQIYVR